MRFLFVDRIVALTSGEKTQGIKWVMPHDAYLLRDLQGETILMPAIVGEAIGQLCAWNVMQATQFRLRPVAGVVGAVNLFGTAKLGDCIELNSEIIELSDDSVRYHGFATVHGETIVTVEDAIGPMLAMDMFIDPDAVSNQFEQLFRPGEFQSFDQEKCLHTCDHLPESLEGYDFILERQPGKHVVAAKTISFQAPYFMDHFPRKPVFPLTLLANANIQLAVQYLKENGDPTVISKLNTVRLSKIKMNRFVQLGDSIVTTMRIISNDEEKYVFEFDSAVVNKRVARHTVEFSHAS